MGMRIDNLKANLAPKIDHLKEEVAEIAHAVAPKVAEFAKAVAKDDSVKAFAARAGAQVASAGVEFADAFAGQTSSSVGALVGEGAVVVLTAAREKLKDLASDFEA